MRVIALGLIRLYQRTLSRWLPSMCRFTPSCSRYGYEAIERFGLWRGGWLTLRRLARCNPWSKGGQDPVPEFCPRMGGKSRLLLIAAGCAAILAGVRKTSNGGDGR